MSSRKLLACPSCRRQYDVTHAEPKSSIECECGERLSVHERRSHAPRALRCSTCGGNLRDGARSCDYCGSEITLEERRLTSMCPCCFARMGDDARFCMECGVRIEPRPVAAEIVGVPCPRCSENLHRRAVGAAEVAECRTCAGLWVEPHQFDAICRDAANPRSATRWDGTAAPPNAVHEAHPMRYLPCAKCGDLMVRRNFGKRSGVIIDVCRRHGVWLDHAELEKVVLFVRAGGGERPLGQGPQPRLDVQPLASRTPAGSTGPATFGLGLGLGLGPGADALIGGALGVLGDALAGLFE